MSVSSRWFPSPSYRHRVVTGNVLIEKPSNARFGFVGRMLLHGCGVAYFYRWPLHTFNSSRCNVLISEDSQIKDVFNRCNKTYGTGFSTFCRTFTIIGILIQYYSTDAVDS